MNLNNIKNLLRAYFIENWKRDFIWTFIMMAAITFLMAIMMNIHTIYPTIAIVFVIMLFIFPERVFNSLYGNSKSIHYLMIPATNSEKVVANMFLVNLYAPFFLLLSVFIGYSLGFLALKWYGLPYLGDYMSHFKYINLGKKIFLLYMLLSVMFFGCIYFRRRATLSTVGMALLAFVVIGVLAVLTLWANVHLTLHTGLSDIAYSFPSSVSPNETPKNGEEIINIILRSLVIVFFYAMSFLRLKETEA